MAWQVMATESRFTGARSSISLCCGLVMLLSGSAAGANELLLDVLTLRGETEAVVARSLGQPEDCGETYQGLKCTYGENIEVTFIEGRADWFQFAPEGVVPFEPAAIRLLGLLPTQPVIRNPFRMHWIDHQGLAVVSVFSGGRYVSLFQIRSYTP